MEKLPHISVSMNKRFLHGVLCARLNKTSVKFQTILSILSTEKAHIVIKTKTGSPEWARFSASRYSWEDKKTSYSSGETS